MGPAICILRNPVSPIAFSNCRVRTGTGRILFRHTHASQGPKSCRRSTFSDDGAPLLTLARRGRPVRIDAHMRDQALDPAPESAHDPASVPIPATGEGLWQRFVRRWGVRTKSRRGRGGDPEHRIFHALCRGHKDDTPTDAAYAAAAPTLGYESAAMLDETAASTSASWGLFQIPGENMPQRVMAPSRPSSMPMMLHRAAHPKAFTLFVAANLGMKRAIIDRDRAGFARAYNGPNYAQNDDDGKMRWAYERLSRSALATPARRSAGARQ